MMIVWAFILGMMMALPAAKYPAALYDGNEQTQPVLPPGGTDTANADDYNQNSTEIVAVETDLRAANVNGGKPNHADVHNDQESRIAALEVTGGAAPVISLASQRWYAPLNPSVSPTALLVGLANTNIHVDRMTALPFLVFQGTTFDAIGYFLDLISGAPPPTTIVSRFGIYDSDAAGLPNNLVRDHGEFTDTRGVNTFGFIQELFSSDQVLSSGVYWLVTVTSSALAVNDRLFGTRAPQDFTYQLGYPDADLSALTAVTGWPQGIAERATRLSTSALPASFPGLSGFDFVTSAGSPSGQTVLPVLRVK